MLLQTGLKTKIKKLLKFKQERQTLETEIQQAQDTALLAMTGSSELGLVMQFIERSYGINQAETLAEEFFYLMRQLNLSCSIFMHFLRS